MSRDGFCREIEGDLTALHQGELPEDRVAEMEGQLLAAFSRIAAKVPPPRLIDPTAATE